MITLNMIVKNEEHCIERCLKSVLPYIDEAIIVDTGSTDRTMECISDMLYGVRHDVLERPWVNFSHNRNEAFQLLKQHTAYNSPHVMFIDADEEFKPESTNFSLPILKHDAYYVKHVVPSGYYWRPFLMWTGVDWKYKGVVHEFITPDHWHDRLDNCAVIDHFDSHRNKSQSAAERYTKDAKLLEEEFKSGVEWSARTAFYIAESYRWAKSYREAVHWYIVRMDMEGWDQERWWAAHMLAMTLVETDQPYEIVIRAFRRAHEIRPSRAETLVELARYQYHCGKKTEARMALRQAHRLPMTADTLNVNPACYRRSAQT